MACEFEVEVTFEEAPRLFRRKPRTIGPHVVAVWANDAEDAIGKVRRSEENLTKYVSYSMTARPCEKWDGGTLSSGQPS